MVAKDDWTTTAMADDILVVELLLRIKRSQAAATSSSLRTSPPYHQSLVPPGWGVRMPRSKAAPSGSRFDSAVGSRLRSSCSKKSADSATRCSPTTPLSWSGGASPSTTADGFEESSCPRSKGASTYESTSTTTASRRLSKKKSFAELKEEESSLIKERTYLKREISTLKANCKQQRAKNENFKRIKIDLNVPSARNLSSNFEGAGKAISSQPHERIASASCCVPSSLPPESDYCGESKPVVQARENSFLLPDLNMEPGEESGSEMLYGMS